MALRFAARTLGAAALAASSAATAHAANHEWDWTKVHFDAVSCTGPLVRAVLSAEDSHRLGIFAAKMGFFPVDNRPQPECLKTEVWGRPFPNPVGLAAGFDKDAEVVDALFKLGFGFVEVGSITPEPQPGNPKPRVFRLPEIQSVINRCGFNSSGADVAADNLEAFVKSGDRRGPLGINLGKNKTTEDAAADYEVGVAKLGGFGDYIVVNVSSPNTPGLRSLQGKQALEALIKRVQAARAAAGLGDTPILVKVAPDLSATDRADVADVALKTRLDGLIVGNTTLSRPGDAASMRHGDEAGGLSGAALMELSTEVLSDMYVRTGGKVPLVGCGGVSSGADAYAKLRAGASLVQLYTSLAYQGPAVVPAVKAELSALLEADGFASAADAVGADHRVPAKGRSWWRWW
mmetsp:Transcript_23674/g.61496  ORF Transcript_23674/g.61496 Transcript_23674/m.61496 type:complete len:405 (+) Transcript_23674:242-1456(+)